MNSNKIKLWSTVLLIVAIAFVPLTYFFFNQFYQTGYIVKLGEYDLGITIDKVNIDSQYDTILADIQSSEHLEYIEQPIPHYTEVKRWFIDDEKESIVDQMKGLLQDDIIAWEIVVAGQLIGIVDHIETADLILEKVKSSYAKSDTEQLIFKEHLTINRIMTKPVQLNDPESVVDMLLAVQSPAKIHTVLEGDTLWDIANLNGMPLDEVLAKNPTMGDQIKPGDIVLLTPEIHTLNVISNQIVTSVQDIPFDIETVAPSTGIKPRNGVKGKKEITYIIERENGIEVERTVLNEVIIEQAINQIELKKAQVQIASSINGVKKNSEFIWPADGGIITSGFGMRNGKMHKGIDISGTASFDIRAAYSGEVTYSGSRGTFGNLIIIAHPNGLATYYAHNEDNFVSVGDLVETGETIAKWVRLAMRQELFFILK